MPTSVQVVEPDRPTHATIISSPEFRLPAGSPGIATRVTSTVTRHPRPPTPTFAAQGVQTT